MRAKFTVDSVTHHRYSQEVKMTAVHSGNPEDNAFAEATPSGQLTMTITNKAAHGFLKVGANYFLDFTLADAVLPLDLG